MDIDIIFSIVGGLLLIIALILGILDYNCVADLIPAAAAALGISIILLGVGAFAAFNRQLSESSASSTMPAYFIPDGDWTCDCGEDNSSRYCIACGECKAELYVFCSNCCKAYLKSDAPVYCGGCGNLFVDAEPDPQCVFVS